ncbi:40S ribosomal protein S25 [Coccidioides immitis RMSCC 3703]|uniref:40S ribosomal protein S25 n=1 Tax=Coccidioides immitis RMSCC 3703 TaxID=454286 RepID=A0A0J8TVX9_COCIT|nr:40S ribosomal protein S25 [Coccidioides immitis RMSCC 3703]
MSTSNNNAKHHSAIPAVISEDCRYVAVVNDRCLELHQTAQEDSLLRLIFLHDDIKGGLRFLQWSKPSCLTKSSIQRVLCASNAHISVFDPEDETWAAEIDAGEGTCFVHVDFTPSADEIICFLEFNVQAMVFNLKTGEQRIIKAPKFSGPNGYVFRPRSGHLALLLKVEGNDILSVHEPGTYGCIATATLQMVDVQGLKCSPNGAWIACWGASLAGTAVAIYTADGQYFRTYTGAGNEIGFGVKTIEWSPDSRILALGKQGGTIELINGKTRSIRNFTPHLIGALVQKSNIKHMLWSNEKPELLMTTNDDDVATVHQWICGRAPRIVPIPRADGGKYNASWVRDAGGLEAVVDPALPHPWVVAAPMEPVARPRENELRPEVLIKVKRGLRAKARLVIPHSQFRNIQQTWTDDLEVRVEHSVDNCTSSSSIMAPAASSGGKKQKKKWSKGKVKDKANHAVVLDKTTSEKLYKDVQSYRLITVATLVDRLKINGSLARKALADLEEKGQIKKVVGHSKMNIYTRAVTASE